jgi:single-strand DNA-binding protein
MSTNTVVVAGNTATEVRMNEDGRCASVLLAHTEYYYDSQKQKKENTNFIWVRAYGKLAHTFSEYVLKGNSITVTGKLAGGNYQDNKTKEWQNYLHILVTDVQFHTPRSAKSEEVPQNNDYGSLPVEAEISF